MRKQIAAANWKMNLSLQQAEQLSQELIESGFTLTNDQLAIFAVPYPYLTNLQGKFQGIANVFLAAQNCAATGNGAYTGEVSAAMLESINVQYVIIGHSERREYYHEDGKILAEKVNRAFENNLKPIFCCGEPLSIREAETQNSFVEKQLMESLFHLGKEKLKDFIIAYEPIWAIGTGRTASSDQAQEMHVHIRSVLAKQYGDDTANSISILYGGSVKGANAADIFSKPDVDGGLVGGASLVATEFAAIIKALK